MAGNKKEKGLAGELRAVKYLKKRGFRIRERNYRTPFGEIDIIAEKKGVLSFIEVKFRSTGDFGLPEESVKRAKRSRIVRSAASYVKAKRIKDRDMRFDVLALGPEEDRVELIESAFEALPRYTV